MKKLLLLFLLVLSASYARAINEKPFTALLDCQTLKGKGMIALKIKNVKELIVIKIDCSDSDTI